jgi:hypothetical protein
MSYINSSRVIAKDNDTIADKLFCLLCKGLLVDPKHCTDCQTNICLSCLWKQINPKCNNCDSENFSNADHNIRSELNKLDIRVSCCNEIINYQEHKLHPNKCKNSKRCDFCCLFYFPDEIHICLRIDTYNNEAYRERSEQQNAVSLFSESVSNGQLTTRRHHMNNPKRRTNPIHIPKLVIKNIIKDGSYYNKNEASNIRIYSKYIYKKCHYCTKNDYFEQCFKCTRNICQECTSYAYYKRQPCDLAGRIAIKLGKINVLKIRLKDNWCLFTYLFSKRTSCDKMISCVYFMQFLVFQ